ncbi:hypothetical protein [Streptomyces sp. NPDC013457]|uniref:hypothetical protein n=1 Tax=Streptomyces sp. NPDC013457 TaxID=3364866 RepID=UPI0037015224
MTLSGSLPQSVPADLALRLTRAVPGVVDASAEFTTRKRPSCHAAESAGLARPGPGTPE